MLSHQSESIPQPLCFEHHSEMRLVSAVSGNGNGSAHEREYACQESDCLVRYTSAAGYFLAPSKAAPPEHEILPHVRCAYDDAPMYLGDVSREERSLRLWKCPLCKATSINGKTLIAAAD
jgi:hypothetical protein